MHHSHDLIRLALLHFTNVDFSVDRQVFSCDHCDGASSSRMTQSPLWKMGKATYFYEIAWPDGAGHDLQKRCHDHRLRDSDQVSLLLIKPLTEEEFVVKMVMEE
jgi:hypothetical protein